MYLQKKQETGLDSFGLMFYNNVLSLPVILIIATLTEWHVVMEYEHWSKPGFLVGDVSR